MKKMKFITIKIKMITTSTSSLQSQKIALHLPQLLLAITVIAEDDLLSTKFQVAFNASAVEHICQCSGQGKKTFSPRFFMIYCQKSNEPRSQ